MSTINAGRTIETRGLTVEQQRRCDALRVARDVVRQSRGVATDVDVVDMIAVAQFILTGQDPWVESDVKIDADALGVE